MNKQAIEQYSKFALHVETEIRWFRPIEGQRYAAGSPLFGRCPIENYRYIRESVFHIRMPTIEDRFFHVDGVEIVGVVVSPRFVEWQPHYRRCWFLWHTPERLDGIDVFTADQFGGIPVTTAPLPVIRTLSVPSVSDRRIDSDELGPFEREREFVFDKWRERDERRADFAKRAAEFEATRRKAS